MKVRVIFDENEKFVGVQDASQPIEKYVSYLLGESKVSGEGITKQLKDIEYWNEGSYIIADLSNDCNNRYEYEYEITFTADNGVFYLITKLFEV